MNKKFVIIPVCILLMTLVIPVSSLDINQCNDIDNNDTRYKSYDYNSYSFYEYNDPAVMSEIILETDPIRESPKPTIKETPDDFSWMDYDGQDWTSPVQDQGACGSCWLFAAVGALEGIINIREGYADLDPDLSEQYALSCLPKSGSCKGGNPHRAFKYIMDDSSDGNDCNGIIFEECFPYEGIDCNGCDYRDCDNDPVLCSYKCSNWLDSLLPISDYGYWRPDGSPEDRERIKTQVMEHGPVVTWMAATGNFMNWVRYHHDPDEYYPYEESDDINHCVVIVGWKDDPSIPNGGYWRIKNSWGTFFGYNGFFNIEYGGLRTDDLEIDWVDYNPNDFNWRPVADAGGPYIGDIGQELTFDASGSFAPNSNIVSYIWDFGDDSTGSGVTATHSYSERGVYTVGLTITDDEENVVTDETAAIINFWMEDDSWSYKVDDIDMELEVSEQIISLQGSVNDLYVTVSEDTIDHYKLDFEGKITGDFRVVLQILSPRLLLSDSSIIEGDVLIDKSNLGIKEMTMKAMGQMRTYIGNIPIPIPLPFEINIDVEFDNAFSFIDFPLSTGKEWDLPPINLVVYANTGSSGFNIFNLINRIAKLMGQDLFPPEGYNIGILGGESVFSCSEMESITVEAGTYDAYNISFAGLLNYYFAPSAGNIIKIYANAEDYKIPFGILSILTNGELVSTNYQ